MDQAGNTQIGQFLKKYSSAFLILFFGIVLMLLPSSGKKETQITTAAPPETYPAGTPLQDDLSVLLSQVDGAGNVRVLLTQATGSQICYQIDDNSSGTDTVILTDNNRNQYGLVQQMNPPTYLGAVVLCQGANDPSVKLAITQAVSSATGLGYDKITVLKMK